LEEGERIYDLFSENISKLPDRNFQDVIIIKISLSLVFSIMNDLFHCQVCEFWFESFEIFGLFIIEVLFLKEMEKVQ